MQREEAAERIFYPAWYFLRHSSDGCGNGDCSGSVCGNSAKTNDYRWIDKLNLLLQIWKTDVLFFIAGVAVHRRSAFYNIGNIAVCSINIDNRKHIV